MSHHRMRTRRQRRSPRFPVVFGRVLSPASRREVEAFAAAVAREGETASSPEPAVTEGHPDRPAHA